MDTSSAARIAAVYDPKAFFATEHWKAEEPWTGYGITVCDHFNHWFLNSQQRTFSRMGAPFDSIYRFDLTPADARRYQLLFMVNLFTMDRTEAATDQEYARGERCDGGLALCAGIHCAGQVRPRTDGDPDGIQVRYPPRCRSDADPRREGRRSV